MIERSGWRRLRRERERVSQMSESVGSGGMIRHSEYQGVI